MAHLFLHLKKIRNRNKKAYAYAYESWLRLQNTPEPRPCNYGIGEMAAQAVRNMFYDHNTK